MQIKNESGEQSEGEPVRENVCCCSVFDGFANGLKNPLKPVRGRGSKHTGGNEGWSDNGTKRACNKRVIKPVLFIFLSLILKMVLYA